MVKKQNFKWDEISLGVCYYPEHWDKKLWKSDLERMLNVGITTVRVAEFAWSKFEPTEGNFTFDLFDSFMEVAQEMDMKVIFGTPTATPPVWLTEKYPEVLNATIDGLPYRHGARRHYNYNSKKYQELSSIIVEKMAEHYGKHPSIIGWQIDNELNCELDEFYSESDTLAFREFLQDKYKNLDNLNEAWGTVFWNQTYTDWDQVYVPRRVIQDSNNPHQMLDYSRFISDSTINFCKIQSDILRKYIKEEDFITTNGMFGNLDNHKMAKECLDVYTYDSYPNFAYCMGEDPKNNAELNDRKWSRNLTETRSVCPHFGIMEQQTGANGWNTRMEAPSPKPGQIKLWTMQSIAHGADFVSYFRWRTCTKGTEMYWHGILDYDNCDNRKLAEIKDISQRVEKLKPMTSAENKASFAVLKDYSNNWDTRIDNWHRRVDGASNMEIFVASQVNHTPVDYIYLQEDTSLVELTQYPVLFYPHAVILNDKNVKLLEDYVSQGGTLILGCRTGQKDETGQCTMTKMPGLATNLTGASVSDFTFVGPNDPDIYVDWEGKKLEAPIFNDIFQVEGENAKVLGTYQGNYYDGKPGLIENKLGKGKVFYYGSTFTRDNVKVFLEHTGILSPHKDIIDLDKDCELVVRQKDNESYYIVLNYAHQSKNIELKQEMLDLDTGKNVVGEISLKAYETKVYRLG